MSAFDQKERIRNKPSLKTSDPVTINTSSKDSVKSLFSMDYAELRYSTHMRKNSWQIELFFVQGMN